MSLTPRSRYLLGGVLVVLIAGGVIASLALRSDNSKAQSQSAPIATSTTSAAAAAVAATGEQPPQLVNTGDDFDAVVRSMLALGDWMYNHGRPELLDQFMLPSAAGYDDAKHGLMNLASKGWRYDPPRASQSVELVRVTDRPSPDQAFIFIRFGPIPPYRVVDPQGRVVFDKPGGPGNVATWTLNRVDGRWMIANTQDLGAAPK